MLVALGALGGAAILIASLTAWASTTGDSSSTAIKRVGLMHVGTDHIPPALEPLTVRLNELGWTEGKNIQLIFRNLEPEQVAGQANAFVNEGVDVIVAFEDQSIDAARGDRRRPVGVHTNAGANPRRLPPSVGSAPRRPDQEPVLSRRKPDGRGPRDVVAKQLEVYQAVVPGLRRVLTLVDPKDPRTERTLKQYRDRRRTAAATTRAGHP